MRRYKLFCFFIILFLILCIAQLVRIFFVLDIDKQKTSKKQAELSSSFYRKTIKDRNNVILAIDVPSNSLIINPSLVDNNTFFTIANTLKLDSSIINRYSTHKEKNSKYIKLASNITQKQKEALQSALMDSLNLKSTKQLEKLGISFQESKKRFYPLGESLAQTIGIVNENNIGQLGIEQMLNDELSTQNFSSTNDITLTIDAISQAIAYDLLKTTINSYQAKRGAIAIADVKTGELLVSAVYPSFDPNNKKNLDFKNTQNIIFTEQVEPGSSIKPLILAKYLDTTERPITSLSIGDKSYKIGTFTIKDTHVPKTTLTLSEVIQYSSNIGILQVSQLMGKQNLSSLFEELGFGYKTNVNFLGEKEGFIANFWDTESKWLTSSYGYSVELTLAQLLNAYQALANDGKFVSLKLVRDAPVAYSSQVFSKETSQQILRILKSTAVDGTAKRARIDGYKIGAKTSTTRKIIDGAYSDKNHLFALVGVVPIDNPKLVGIVWIDNPQIGQSSNVEQSAGLVVAPVFSTLMKQILLINDILPSN